MSVQRAVSSSSGAPRSPSQGQGAAAADPQRELPVFIFPNTLHFFASEKDSLRQILTIYNPYDFPLRFRVYCTAPKLYSVVDAQGTVKPGFCSDVIIRHNAPVAAHFNKPDKFRIHIYDAYASPPEAPGGLLGRKTFEAVLRDKRSPHSRSADADEESDSEFAPLNLPHSASSAAGAARSAPASPPPGAGAAQWQPALGRRGKVHFGASDSAPPPPVSGPPPSHLTAPSPLIVLLGVLCVAALCLPTDGHGSHNQNSPWPVYLHLTLNQKLVAAYILGLVTMVILRS
ncbi:motile sperm domain-containing protein 1-like [Paramacrobiotus metropolitanus]|uniref:motile sperm domain-containing protein 1-like n=1 Tax=Paramacrobiotus metropolitanus TaxID=2943436 RepID=UPI002445AF2E|nr:motile sperm domain-containing protein 1-like [Paramacrobiotus metropolitanus]